MKIGPSLLSCLPVSAVGFLGICSLSAAQGPVATASGSPALLTLDLHKPGPSVSPRLYGLMTEEINHSYDGGIYAELIQNRIFKDDSHDPVHWSLVQEGGGSGAISLDETQPINQDLTTCLKLEVTSSGKRVGIANDGFWGIPVRPSTNYRASFYARADGASAPLTVSIESNDSVSPQLQYAQVTAPAPGTGWKQYSVNLTTPADTGLHKGRFVISTASPGTYHFNLVSLFPPTWHDRPNGNRVDLMQLLSDMKPAFLRLPGGNFLEGDTIATRFQWKQTIGPLSRRPGHPGCWRYRASDGLGLLEFLEWCEDLNIQPVLAVYAGYSLKGEHVVPGAALEPFVNEALEEIEYATGDTTTKWGAVRATDGHPAPFQIDYIEIGNEDQFDKSHSYPGRFAQFFDAIKAKYPNLKCIATTDIKNIRVPDVIDEHFYRSAGQMEEDAGHYDKYSRTGPKIFVGEWATREGGPTTNLNAALGDAAWMTGMERNSDVVVLASYAPLFVNVNPGGMEWPGDLIGYDALNSYGSPSYYAQKMFNNYLGDSIVPVMVANNPVQSWQAPAHKNSPPPPPRQVPELFFSATRSNDTVYLKVVNISDNPQPVNINLEGAKEVSPDALSIVLTSANRLDTNSIVDREKVVPAESKVSGVAEHFTQTFLPRSINVLKLKVQ